MPVLHASILFPLSYLSCLPLLKLTTGIHWKVSGMVEVELFEWPELHSKPAVFQEFVQQLNKAEGYSFQDVTLRPGAS